MRKATSVLAPNRFMQTVMLIYVHTFWARAASHTTDVRGTCSYKAMREKEAVNAGRFQNPKGPDGRATDSTQYLMTRTDHLIAKPQT